VAVLVLVAAWGEVNMNTVTFLALGTVRAILVLVATAVIRRTFLPPCLKTDEDRRRSVCDLNGGKDRDQKEEESMETEG
jgi:hypothetical protein